MNSRINTIIFDYGGTLDTDGVHWSEKFYRVYNRCGIPVVKEKFKEAFVYSERNIPGIIKPNFSLKQTYETQLLYQIKYLKDNKLIENIEESELSQMVELCYTEVMNKIKLSKEALDSLVDDYKLAVVSNYYGNVETVLQETGLKKYFKVITDSTVVGIRKPDKKIFKLTLEQLNTKPGEAVIIGDSLKNDINPSKELGCKTIWIEGDSWDDKTEEQNFDVKVNSIKEVPDVIEEMS